MVPPRTADETKRYIPAAVRREVWKRDDGRCAFVSGDGHRCASTQQVQFHHIVAHAKGGLSTVSNLSLRCAAHNKHHAELDFGASHVAGAIARSREAAAQPGLVEASAGGV
jgi:5-methylcytosine-specific restriction endonuclease McrA